MNILKKVFISRGLVEGSVFKEKLQDNFQIIDLSLIAFSLLPFHEVKMVDWIFFYSKKAVHYYFKGLKAYEYPIPEAKLAAIGAPTAAAIRAIGFEPDFVGTGAPEETAHRFEKYAVDQSVLFPRAENSRKSIQQKLSDKIKAKDLIVYQNKPLTDFEIEACDILVFTSPLNAETYFKKYKRLDHQILIAIGNTTALTLKELGQKEFSIAEKPSEQALADLVLELGK